MKHKKLKFKLISLLALACFAANGAMHVAAGNDADVKPCENNKPVENINVKENGKPGENINVKENVKPGNAVEHEEVSGFKFLKEMKITNNPFNNILFYEHERTKMKIVVIPHDYFKMFYEDFDYYLFFRVKDGFTKNGINRNELKHILEHLLTSGDEKYSYFQSFYNGVFGLGNATDVDNIGRSNAHTKCTGLGFKFSDLKGLNGVFNQLVNPYFKTEMGRKLFNREVIGERVNKATNERYKTGRIITEGLIKNGCDVRGGFLDDDGNLKKELLKAKEFLIEGKNCEIGLLNSIFGYIKFSEQEIYDGACDILDEMVKNLDDSMLVIPSYFNIPNTPGYSAIMKHVDSECLSKFKDYVNNGKKPRNEKVFEFENKPFELVAEGITGGSEIFNYEECEKKKEGDKECFDKYKMFKAKDVAYLKVNLGDKYSEEEGWFGNFFCVNQLKDLVKQLGYKDCSARIEDFPDKNYLLVELYGNEESLFTEEKLRDTYKKMLEELLKLTAEEIYTKNFERTEGDYRHNFNYDWWFHDAIYGLIRMIDSTYKLTGGFDDGRLGVYYDAFKRKYEFVQNKSLVTNLNYMIERYINKLRASLNKLKEFENSVPEILVLQRPSGGGEEIEPAKSAVEQYRKVSPIYEAYFKFKDGFSVNPAAMFFGLRFLNEVGIDSELSDCGVFYGWDGRNLQVEMEDKTPKYCVFFPAIERGGFDEFFNTPEQFRACANKVLSALNEKDFNKFKEKKLESFKRGGEKLNKSLKEHSGYGLEDLKAMTLDDIRKVIENVEVGETKFLPKQ